MWAKSAKVVRKTSFFFRMRMFVPHAGWGTAHLPCQERAKKAVTELVCILFV